MTMVRRMDTLSLDDPNRASIQSKRKLHSGLRKSKTHDIHSSCLPKQKKFVSAETQIQIPSPPLSSDDNNENETELLQFVKPMVLQAKQNDIVG